MGLRFRKSVKIAPGVRLNFGKKSTSISIGGKGARYTVSSTGKQTASVGIPGTGLSYVETVGGKKPEKDNIDMSNNKIKKPFFKKWWFWIILILLLGAFSASGRSDTTDDTMQQVETETSSVSSQQDQTVKEQVESIVTKEVEDVQTVEPEAEDSKIEPEEKQAAQTEVVAENTTTKQSTEHVDEQVNEETDPGIIEPPIEDPNEVAPIIFTPVEEQYVEAPIVFEPVPEETIVFTPIPEEPTIETAPVVTPQPEQTVQAAENSYVVNTNTMKFHEVGCSSVADIKDHNRMDYTGSRDALISQGYAPCGRCHP